jgi:hypothetical protein
MSRLTGKLAKLKKHIEDLTVSMHKFCLEPSYEKFKEICACESIRRQNEENFEAWRLAVLYKFSEEWELTNDIITGESLESLHEKFLKLESNLCEVILDKPSQTIANKIIHIYFATGELKYIDLFYQIMGHENISLTSRQQIAGVYNNVRELYMATVASLLHTNPNHFDDRSIDVSSVDFSYFDKYKKDLSKHRENRKAENEIAAKINNPDDRYMHMPTSIYGITPKK